MKSIIEVIKYVYECYGLFILEKESQIYTIDNCVIRNFMILGLLTLSHFDNYAISDNDICFYLICNRYFLLGNQPHFRIFNDFPYIDCQSYPLMLADLPITKQVFIACIHLFVSIFKLKLSETCNLIAYSCIKGHMVLLL